MHSIRFTAVASMLLASAGAAYAERNPTPPPSGIVVHLFGPHGVMTPILPGDDTHQSTHGQTGGSASGSTASAAGSANALQTSDDPDIHDILHQMFVTGDPNDPNKPASGRPGERQPVAK